MTVRPRMAKNRNKKMVDINWLKYCVTHADVGFEVFVAWNNGNLLIVTQEIKKRAD
jgi:hypothetical protein